MDLTARFVETFRRGIEAEKQALRKGSPAHEVPLKFLRGEGYLFEFTVLKPSERLAVGVECGLRDPSGMEFPARLVQVERDSLVLRCEGPSPGAGGAYTLVFVPWFLYDEMSRALQEVPFPESALRAFGKVAVGRNPLPPARFRKALNPTQQKAVQQALESELTLLWGPPGTGKTTTLAELVANLVNLGRRLLITSTTHAALDQVLEKLVEQPELRGSLLRLGESGAPTYGCSLSETVDRHHSRARLVLERGQPRLDAALARRSRLQPLLHHCQAACAQAQQLDLFAQPPDGLSAEELNAVLDPERSARLAQRPAKEQLVVLERLHNRLERLLKGWQVRLQEARAQRIKAQQQVVEEAPVILTTLASNYVSPLLRDQVFDSVIIEEAGMALLPAVYLAASRARSQVILVGDPQQLPAILNCREPFAQQALARNIFEVVGPRPERIMLDLQYRMHPVIGDLVSQLFYEGGLRHQPHPETSAIAAAEPFAGEPVVVMDSAGQGPCQTEPGEFSRYNRVTAGWCVDLAAQAAAQGLSVAVIAPYRKQVARIQELLRQRGLEEADIHCATVHRFQGNERDVVILDTVDGPPLPPGTLLNSANLLNVSLSRSRGKLILIADLPYLRDQAAGTMLARVVQAALGFSTPGQGGSHG